MTSCWAPNSPRPSANSKNRAQGLSGSASFSPRSRRYLLASFRSILRSHWRRRAFSSGNLFAKEIVKHGGVSLLAMFPSVPSETRIRSNVPCSVDTPPLHFVYHVPKCAGRTIDRHLASALPVSAYHRVSGSRRGMGRLMRRYDRAHLPDPQTTLVVSGHHLGIFARSAIRGPAHQTQPAPARSREPLRVLLQLPHDPVHQRASLWGSKWPTAPCGGISSRTTFSRTFSSWS